MTKHYNLNQGDITKTYRRHISGCYSRDKNKILFHIDQKSGQ